jgi:hypothetical protein
MNERIKELAEQAGFMDSWFSESGDDCEKEIKKLTELIIQECSKVIETWKKEPFPFDEDTAVSIIHEHFGIELPPKTIRVIKI